MITEKLIDTLDGKDVVELSLTSDLAEVKLLNYGCVVRDWRVKTANGMVPVILGLDDYLAHRDSLPSGGAVCGRVGNRIAKGQFTLNGTEYQLPLNDGSNHLHGGPGGFDKLVWDYTLDHAANTVIFTLHSPDGDQGYPGNLDVRVSIRLDRSSLIYDMSAETDAPTPVNLAQHSYYNLNGEGDVFDHVIHARAAHYTPTDDDLIPTGEIASVTGSLYDFTSPTTFAATDPDRHGVDGNLVLDEDRDMSEPAVTVTSELAQPMATSLTILSAPKSFDRMRTEPAPSMPHSARAAPPAQIAARLTAPAAKVLVIFMVVVFPFGGECPLAG